MHGRHLSGKATVSLFSFSILVIAEATKSKKPRCSMLPTIRCFILKFPGSQVSHCCTLDHWCRNASAAKRSGPLAVGESSINAIAWLASSAPSSSAADPVQVGMQTCSLVDAGTTVFSRDSTWRHLPYINPSSIVHSANAADVTDGNDIFSEANVLNSHANSGRISWPSMFTLCGSKEASGALSCSPEVTLLKRQPPLGCSL